MDNDGDLQYLNYPFAVLSGKLNLGGYAANSIENHLFIRYDKGEVNRMLQKITGPLQKAFSRLPYSFVTWMSHFAVLLLSSVIIIILLNQSYGQATISTISTLNGELTNYVEKTYSQIQNMIKYNGFYTFYSPSAAKLRHSKELTNFEVISGIRELNALVGTSTYVHSVYVYNADNQYIYSTYELGSNTVADFPDRSAVELFRQGVSAEDSFEPVHRPFIHKTGNNTENVYSFILYETDNGRDFENALMINIYEDEYNNSFFGSNYDQEIILVKETGQLIYHSKITASDSTNISSDVMKRILESGQKNGYILEEHAKGKTVYLYSYMDELGRFFIRRLRYDDIMDSLTGIRNLSFFIVMTILLSGGIISLIMLTRIYLPLKKIIHSLSGRPKADKVSDSVLRNLDYWVRDRVQDKQIYILLVKQEFLKQLLTASVSQTNNMEQDFQKYEIDLSAHSPFQLLLVKDLSAENSVCALKEAFPHIRAEGVSMDNLTVLFIQPGEPDSIESFCNCLLNGGGSFCCSSSPIHDYFRTERSYLRMKELYALRIFYAHTQVLTEDFLNAQSEENLYPEEQETKIIQALKSGKNKQAVALYQEWLAVIARHRYSIIVFAFKRLFLTIRSLQQQVVSASNMPLLPEELEFVENKLKTAVSLDEVNEIFFELFSQICCKITMDRKFRTERLIREIKQMVEKSYTDPNLSPQKISDMLHLSVTYTGKLFRACEKCSISDYINKTRILQAQKLLENGELTVREIARKSGFENLSYFFTLFKNYTQMSPAVFRESCLKK